ncbi:MAG: hypothetical protein R2873_29565 [Caldilineaceae bacterium]
MIDEAVTLSKTADVAVLYIALPTFKESKIARPGSDAAANRLISRCQYSPRRWSSSTTAAGGHDDRIDDAPPSSKDG